MEALYLSLVGGWSLNSLERGLSLFKLLNDVTLSLDVCINELNLHLLLCHFLNNCITLREVFRPFLFLVQQL